MACCIGIAKLNDGYIGDPLDIEMFKFTNWDLEEPEQIEGVENVIQILKPKDSQQSTSLLRRFDFTSTLMRSSVIVKQGD